jgi:response regulator RpfG family c-di-GMP phosphodiesterase
MGRINGFDIFRRLAELNKTPAKILITGTPDPSLTEKNLESVGLHGFVLKPWDDDVFKRMVKKALG